MLQDIVNQLQVLDFANEFALFWNQSANSLNSIPGAYNASALLGLMNNIQDDSTYQQTAIFIRRHSVSNYKLGISRAAKAYLLSQLKTANASDAGIQALNSTAFDPNAWVQSICMAFNFPAGGINCTDAMTLTELFAVRLSRQVCVYWSDRCLP